MYHGGRRAAVGGRRSVLGGGRSAVGQACPAGARSAKAGYAAPMRIRTLCLVPFALCLSLLLPSTAAADATLFLGINPTPVNRTVRGFAAGIGLVIVGFEFEFANTTEDTAEAAPGLKTYMFNGLVQTPIPIGGMQFSATAGGGAYRETLNDVSETHVGINVGGGVKMKLVGPLRLRLDYRVFTLRGQPLHPRPQRFYAGVNLKF
jgi:opacity protein-like surface antigen